MGRKDDGICKPQLGGRGIADVIQQTAAIQVNWTHGGSGIGTPLSLGLLGTFIASVVTPVTGGKYFCAHPRCTSV